MNPQQLYPQVRHELLSSCAQLLESHTLGVLLELQAGPRRFMELQRGLGVSSKTLASKLRLLEERRLLTRTSYAEVPPKVVYALTEKGQQLASIVLGILAWEEGWQ